MLVAWVGICLEASGPTPVIVQYWYLSQPSPVGIKKFKHTHPGMMNHTKCTILLSREFESPWTLFSKIMLRNLGAGSFFMIPLVSLKFTFKLFYLNYQSIADPEQLSSPKNYHTVGASLWS